MINPQSPVRLKRTQILRTAAQYGGERLCVFGSGARGTEDGQSDIDFLVELAPDRSLLDPGNVFTKFALCWESFSSQNENLVEVWMIHHLQIIEETAARVSNGLREKHPEAAWGGMGVLYIMSTSCIHT